MPNVIRYLAKAALLSATLSVVALPGMARAQSGSAGGSIGNDQKSLSGSREAPRAAEPSKPARRSKPEGEEPSRASRKSGGGGNGGSNFDGAWVLTSVGTPCGSSTDTVVITSGRMVGQYGTAQVSPNGSTSGIGAAGSLTWSMSGRLSGPQRLRFIPTIRWMCRKLDRIKTVVVNENRPLMARRSALSQPVPWKPI